MLNKIKLNDIHTFILIVKFGSFTKAAEALSVSRSHISKQLSQLEKNMGVTLIQRTTRRLKLTSAGQKFFKNCNDHILGIEQAMQLALEDVEQISGTIKINCIGGYLGEDIFSPIIARFSLKYPDVTIKIDFSSHKADFMEDEVDLIIRMGQLEDADFIARHLCDLEMVTLASPMYINQTPKITHPKDLNHHNCLTGSIKKWNFQNKNTKTKIDIFVNGNLECKNGRSLIHAALAGSGIIRVPKIYCLDAIKEERLISIMPNWQIPNVPLSIIYHKDRYQAKRLKVFIAYLQNAFTEQMQP